MTVASLEEQAVRARDWWRALQPLDLEGRRVSGDRAALARLRRCASPLEAASEPAAIALYRKLGLDHPERDLPRVAVLAGVLAHVRASTRGSLARQLGSPPGGEPQDALLKPLRFKRLVAARGPDETMTAFRRVVHILDGEANVRDLARLMLAWDAAGLGDRVRTRFAFDYHGARFAAPGAESRDGADASHSNED
jgi:CRISPR system Cascade subunit CasB